MPSLDLAPAWRQQGATDRRADLLAAARAEFAEHGYHAATVGDIAARAEVGKGTVYLDFPDGKAGLRDAVVAAHLTALAEMAAASFGQTDGTVRYRFWTFALAVGLYFRQRPDLVQIHLREVARLVAEGDPAVAGYAGVVAPVEAALAEAAEAGAIRACAPDAAARGLLGALFSVLLGRGLGGYRPPGAPCPSPTDDADAVASLLFDGLGRGPAA